MDGHMRAARQRSRRNSVATRITVAIAAMLVPVAVAVGGGAVALDTATHRLDDAATKTELEVRPISDIRSDLAPLATDAFKVLYRLESATGYRRLFTQLDRDFALARARQQVRDEATLKLEQAQREWRRLRGEMLRFVDAGNAPDSEQLKVLVSQFTQLGETLTDAEDATSARLRARRDEAARNQHAAIERLLALAVAAVVAAAVLAYALTRSVSRPLRQLRRGVDRIAQGNLTQRIELNRRDELGQLGDALDAMASDLHEARNELQRVALHDALTGLPNRTLLLDRLEQAVARLARGNDLAALLLVDLDEFKVINDTMGHLTGDAVLASVGARLTEQLRDFDTASRIGGDEFAVLVEGLTDEAEVLAVAERIRRAINEPLDVNGSELRPAASIGVATASEGTEEAAELLRNADLAMYAAKQAGRDRCVVFEASMRESALERAQLERALRAAVHRDELVLHYQPTIDLGSGRITGVEALIRWEHPELGMMPPAKFIPLAEETGIIVPLGRWVLREACAQLCEWQRAEPERYAEFKMNVNLSARQLERPGVVADVEHALEQTGLDPRHLVLELTESTLAGGDELLERLQQLRALGVRLAVDDFGTGYSSLAYLRRFPIDILKIDRSFISGIASRSTDATLASTIIDLGRMLDLTTVAEGIEDAQQLELLRSLGCSMGQGYLIAKPLPATELAAFVAQMPAYPVPDDGKAEAARAATQSTLLSDVAPALLNAAADCLALIDDKARLQYASDAARRLLGFAVEEWLGRDVFELVHPDDIPAVVDAWVNTVATPGVKAPLALRLLCANDEYLPVEIVSTNMLDEPSVGGVVIVIRDRSERAMTAGMAPVTPER
jgi:diguanylate cyclase (GGDEF)-like protein/PAS domain S-box-containing protein